MTPVSGSDLDSLTSAVLTSPRYRDIDPGFVRSIAVQEIERSRNQKEVVKAIKNKLHQVVGAYLENHPDYSNWSDLLQSAAANPDRDQFLLACRTVMAHHASTRERLPILDRFYRETLQGIPQPRRVLDIACGLNPLAIPWMPISPQVEYMAVDVVAGLMEFIRQYFSLIPARGIALTSDVMQSQMMRSMIEFATAGPFDLAFILKTIPCIEQVDKTAGQRLLESIPARYLLVSFPGHSLGGKAKGMMKNYEAHFMDLIHGKGWSFQRFEFPGELAFLLEKPLPDVQ